MLADSNVKHWLTGYDRLHSFGEVTFIPGHGQPGPLKDFDFPTRQYLNLLLTHMDAMVEQGIDVQDAINGLEPLAPGYVYEGWIIVGGMPISSGRFGVGQCVVRPVERNAVAGAHVRETVGESTVGIELA